MSIISELSDNQDPNRRVHFNRQQLALNILHKQNLIPEHIETRNLYTPMHPNTSQGQLHMWVDIFRNDGSIDIPPPIDVSPRKPNTPHKNASENSKPSTLSPADKDKKTPSHDHGYIKCSAPFSANNKDCITRTPPDKNASENSQPGTLISLSSANTKDQVSLDSIVAIEMLFC